MKNFFYIVYNMNFDNLDDLGDDIRKRSVFIKSYLLDYNNRNEEHRNEEYRNEEKEKNFINFENCLIESTYNDKDMKEIDKLLIIIACHTSSEGRYHILQENLKYFENYDVVIINTIDYEDKYDYKFSSNIKEIYYIENNVLFDFGKWRYVLENFNYKEYKKILFINDSILLTHNIDNYIKNAYFNDYDLYGFNDSIQMGYHYQSFIFTIKSDKIYIFLDMIKDREHLINNYWDLIKNFEINGICNIYNNKACYLNISKVTNGRYLLFDADEIYEKLLNNNIYPLIKAKRILIKSIPEFILNKIENKSILNIIT